MFYALAKNQEKIMAKVNLFVALAPVARMAKSAVPGGRKTICAVEEKVAQSGIFSIYKNKVLSSNFNNYVKLMNMPISATSTFIEFGNRFGSYYTNGLDNLEALAVSSSHFPQETSTKELNHYAQLSATHSF